MAVLLAVAAWAPPPTGLADADVVYEEYAEGGLIRLIAVFQSRDSAAVGPVTGLRPTDPRVLEVFHGCAALTGASSGFLKQLTSAGVCAIYSAPTTSTGRLYAQLPKGHTPPPPTFLYAGAGERLGSLAKAVKTLVVTPPGGASQTWTYDRAARVWRSVLGGSAVSAANVEVLTSTYRAIVVHSPLRTLLGAPVFGTGAATVVSGAATVHGSWFRPSAKTLTNVVDEEQQVVHLVPGRTWVLFAPTGSTVVTH